MKRLGAFLVLGAVASAMGPAQASVNVSFVEPQRYTDLRQHDFGYGVRSRETILERLRGHLEQLGERHLLPDQSLSIEVLNVDLAGRYEPFLFGQHDGRLATRVTWPSMTMRYVLSEGGREVFSAEERVADLSYLEKVTLKYKSDSLRYEKAMLDAWFYKRFVERKPPR